MCISGYGCDDAYHSLGLQETCSEVLAELLPDTRGLVTCFGLPLLYHHTLFNGECLVVDGEIVGFVAKRFLAGDGIHYEPRWFKGWPAGERGEIEVLGKRYRIGDLHFDVGGIRIGFEICRDAWVAGRPGARLAARGVDVILNPSASHFAFDKLPVRRRFVVEGSRTFAVSYLYSNLLGNEAGRAIYEGGAMIASGGELIASGSRFSLRDWELTTASIDVAATRMKRARMGGFPPVTTKSDEDCVRVAFDYVPAPMEEGGPPPALEAPWQRSSCWKEEEFTRAVALALFDYMRKSRSRGFVVSVSGGADSSACASLVALMARLAVEELGLKGVTDKLDYWPELCEVSDLSGLVSHLLLCVYQGTRNSSEMTYEAARGLAESLGADFLRFDVDSLVEGYKTRVGEALGRELTWEKDDLALQNIQARVRGPGVWLLANIRGALLVATSNRSEAAVGYATMDGDTCGGISPIAGIDKAFLLRWLRWLETQGPEGIGPIPALAAVNAQQPTAELRPPTEHQTDEEDLMPYEILDAIERAAIRDKMMPIEVWGVVQRQFPEVERGLLSEWVERFFVLWCQNQWKRERYAPSFHLDDENLDPKTWCRFPILSGGFERELDILREQRVSE
jgi:NAD+ synthase (glutamine-hydrolysing)